MYRGDHKNNEYVNIHGVANNDANYMDVDGQRVVRRDGDDEDWYDEGRARENIDNYKIFNVDMEVETEEIQKFQIHKTILKSRNVVNYPELVALTMDKYNQLKNSIQHTVKVVIDFKGHPISKVLYKDEVSFDYISNMIKENENRYGKDDYTPQDVTITFEDRRIPGGAGVDNKYFESVKNALSRPRCVDVVPSPAYCVIYAILLATATENQRKNYLKKDRRKKFDDDVMEFAQKHNLPMYMNVSELDSLLPILGECYIRVYDGNMNSVYKSKNKSDNAVGIYLLLHDDHYYNINNINGFFNDRKSNMMFCESCETNLRCVYENGEKRVIDHQCTKPMCIHCKKHFDSDDDLLEHRKQVYSLEMDGDSLLFEKDSLSFDSVSLKYYKKCGVCNNRFYSQECMDYHRCDKTYCEKCKRKHKRGNEHVCGERFCGGCKTWLSPDKVDGHICYMKPLGAKPKEYYDGLDYYAFDIESTLTESMTRHGVKPLHEVSIIVVEKLYSDQPSRVFHNIHEFVNFIKRMPKQARFYAHNAKNYDSFLLISEVINNSIGLRIGNMVEVGRKIIQAEIGKIILLDSMSHFGGSLEKQIADFGLKEKLESVGAPLIKGFFPYRFYSKDRVKYVGDIPSKKWFDVSDKKRGEFEEWYAKYRSPTNPNGIVYDLAKECVTYCKQDVKILRYALEAYRDTELAISGVDPLRSATIASHTMKVMRTNYLRSDTIFIPPKRAYNFARRAMHGGRTNAYVLKYKARPGWTIRYADANSMYPFVLSMMLMPYLNVTMISDPVGVDATVESNHAYIHRMFGNDPLCANVNTGGIDVNMGINTTTPHVGILECDIECPQMLLPPLIRANENNKIIDSVLPLKKEVFCTPELITAIRDGYRVIRIYEVAILPCTDGLFKDYIKRYYDVKKSADKKIKDIKELMELDAAARLRGEPPIISKEDVEKELAMANRERTIAKSMLNNLWGKFGQNDEMTTTKYIRDPAEWYKLAAKERKKEIEISTTEYYDHEEEYKKLLYVKYKKNVAEGEREPLKNTNIFIAAFVTSYARMVLYEGMRSVMAAGGEVLYGDTDSIIYAIPNEALGKELNFGPELGQWKLETDSPIVEYAALGPKTYAFLCEDDIGKAQSCIKSKGFSVDKFLDSENRKMTMSVYKELLDGFYKSRAYRYTEFKKEGRSIITQQSEKILKFEYDKRIIVDDYRTVPFGYVSSVNVPLTTYCR